MMATKRKIGASLRQSVTAEKQKVADTKQPSEKSAKPNPVKAAVVNKPVTVTEAKPAPKKPSVPKKVNQVSNAAKPSIATKTVEKELPKATATPASKFPEFKINQDLLNSVPKLNEVLDQLTSMSNKLANLFLENMHSTNSHLNEYLLQLGSLKDPASLYELNMKLMNKLKASQQEIFSKNLEFFSFYKKK
ncbi:hypothetical protein [Aquella oligotrophica]|nr:hypothetical protein [Aquella oligotrophica]